MFGRYRIDHKVGLTVRIFGRRFLLLIKWHIWFCKGGKCGCFVLINKWFFEVNPPYGQSNFTVNPDPSIFVKKLTIELTLALKQIVKSINPRLLLLRTKSLSSLKLAGNFKLSKFKTVIASEINKCLMSWCLLSAKWIKPCFNWYS